MCLCLSQPALSDLSFPEIPSKNRPLSISLQTEFFRSTGNYIEWVWDDLPDENYLQYVGFYPVFRYSPFYYFDFQIFAKNFYAESKTQETKRNVLRTSFIGGGVSFYHRYKTIYLGLEMKGGIPLHRKDFEGPDEMIIGDGTYFVEPGFWFLFRPTRKFYLHYNTAFRYRMSGLSSLLFNRVGGFLRTKNTDFGFFVNSFVSVLSDNQQRGTRLESLQKVNGGSFRFRSFNPSVLSFTFWMEFKFKPAFVKLYLDKDSFGKYYARGFNVGLITTLRWNTKPPTLKRKRKTRSFDFDEDYEAPSSESPSKEKSYFKEEKDPYGKEKMNRELREELRSLRY